MTTPLRRLDLRHPVVPSEQWDVRRMGPEAAGGGQVYLWEDAVEELIYAGLSAPRSLQTALLAGGSWEGPDGRFIEVRGYTELGRPADLGAFCRELTEDWTLVRNRVARRDPPMLVLGWVVMGPDVTTGDGLAEELQRVHRTFFNLPHQVTLTISTSTSTVALYGFDERGRLINIGFHLVRRRAHRGSGTAR